MISRRSPAGCVQAALFATWLLGACAAGSPMVQSNGTSARRTESYLATEPATTLPITMPGRRSSTVAPSPPNAPARPVDAAAPSSAAGLDLAQETAALGVAAVARPEPADMERSLRQELATAEDPTASALELAGLLCAEERHGEALVVVQQAETRAHDPRLRVARAGLQRDLGQRHLAVAELQALVREHGAEALHPGLVFELAELNWLEGNGTEALADLARIEEVHRGDPWCVAHRRQLADLATEIHRGKGPQRVRVRDLLGNLRGAPNVSTRIAVLEQFATATSGVDEVTEQLRMRAVAIACSDASPVVRARAVQLARPTAEAAAEFYRTALADAATIVRRSAAARAVESLGPGSASMLLDCLANEEDPATFVALHGALAAVLRTPPQLPVDGGETAAGRATVVAAWREQCSR